MSVVYEPQYYTVYVMCTNRSHKSKSADYGYTTFMVIHCRDLESRSLSSI